MALFIRLLVFGLFGPPIALMVLKIVNLAAGHGMADLSFRFAYAVATVPALLLACIDQYFAKQPLNVRLIQSGLSGFLGTGLLLMLPFGSGGFLLFAIHGFFVAFFCSLLTDLVLRQMQSAKSS